MTIGEKEEVMIVDKSVSEFVQDTASESPVPGGGSASALAGALAAALSAMVAQLTITKKNDEDSKSSLVHLKDAADALRTELIQGVDRDTAAYQNFLCALRLPKTTPLEQEKRKSEIALAKKEICQVPFSIAENAFDVLKLAGRAVIEGRKDVVTDSAVAVLLAKAAARGALYNVKFNLSAVTDEAYVTQLLDEVTKMERTVEEEEKTALAAVGL